MLVASIALCRGVMWLHGGSIDFWRGVTGLHGGIGELAGENTAAEVDGDGEEEIVEGVRMSPVRTKVSFLRSRFVNP